MCIPCPEIMYLHHHVIPVSYNISSLTLAVQDEQDIIIIHDDGGVIAMETIALHGSADYKLTIIRQLDAKAMMSSKKYHHQSA